MTTAHESWAQTLTALDCLAQNPSGLGGCAIRMRAGPDRDTLLTRIKSLFPTLTKITPSVDDLHLFGGTDLSATLSRGVHVTSQGVLGQARPILLTMAERCTPELAAKLGQYLDTYRDAVLIALDEGAEEAETIPTALAERLAFRVEPLGHYSGQKFEPDIAVDTVADSALDIATLAQKLGVASARASLMTLNAAKALSNGAPVCDWHIQTAAILVLVHRATSVPTQEPPADQAEPNPQEPNQSQANNDDPHQTLPHDLVLEAIKAHLPANILAGLQPTSFGPAKSGAGQGHKKTGNRRGRPLPARPGRLEGANKLDLLATLRAAAPWQKLRRKRVANGPRLQLRPSDFRIKRYETKSDRLIIFAVDASGSAAVARLGEVKGAIELQLGEAYAERDHIALITFRGESADCLLPPTRSLVQAKRKLTALPGGGGTPLALGLLKASEVALQARSKGMTPITVLLTDGKANIALDGQANRSTSREDAVKVAKSMLLHGLTALVVDTGRRANPGLRELAQIMDARYTPLPRSDARSLQKTVNAALASA